VNVYQSPIKERCRECLADESRLEVKWGAPCTLDGFISILCDEHAAAARARYFDRFTAHFAEEIQRHGYTPRDVFAAVLLHLPETSRPDAAPSAAQGASLGSESPLKPEA
jgi:hypothetical protein